jgi:hypothetical protein
MSKYVDAIPDPVMTMKVKEKTQRYAYKEDGTYGLIEGDRIVEKQIRNIVLPWYVVKDQIRAVVEHGEGWPSQPSGYRLKRLYDKPTEKEVWSYTHKKTREGYKDHLGRQRYRTRTIQIPDEVLASGADLSEWFKNGYRAEAFENLADRVPSALQNRPVWSDEDGDLEVNRLYGGFDDFYMGMAERPAKPGIRLQIEMAFAAMVKQKTIEEYGGWVNSLIGSMEAYGIDMVIDLWIPLDDLFEGDHGVRTNVLVRVKNANEVCDFTDWSILFSPGGYRQVGFAAKCVAGDRVGKRVNSYYGNTIGGKTWGLDYDRDESIVRITVNQRAMQWEAIPFDALTKKAVEIGLIPKIPEFNLGV